MHTRSFSVTIAGKTITADFTDLTSRADGAVIIRAGETAVLVTAVMSDRTQPGLSYFPLSVEFEEKFYAAGAILGSRFMRREGRPSEEAVLSARIIDRTIRPLFNHQLRNDVQVVATVLAMGEDDPDVLGVIGASLALAVSNIPWDGPVGAVRIGRRQETGEIIINPTYQERSEGKLDFEVLACGKDGKINMIETAANEIGEDDLIAVLEAGTQVHAQLEAFQHEVVRAIGNEKRTVSPRELPDALATLFTEQFQSKLSETLFNGQSGKGHLDVLKDEFVATATTLDVAVDPNHAADYFAEQLDTELHRGAVTQRMRPDGRDFDEIRPLFAQAGNISPALHGSGIFYRGDTHIFTALTLAGPEAALYVDTIEEQETKKRFMHHYNFPPFSVGETGRVGGFNRRMIGHGALAEKALAPIIPEKTAFPYTIRLVSETMSANGSSSMGSVCAATLALMDGGVPITRPVAGIASGLLMHGDEYRLLTDIQGPEDEYGDMDFKVAGTRAGITAIQMDVKIDGIAISILAEALAAARVARLQLLDVIEAELATPRARVSSRAPKIITLSIKPEQIGLVIGSGGKTINSIKDDTAVEEISIEEDGTVFICGHHAGAEAAAERIRALTKVYEVGDRVTVEITRLVPFGAFARLDSFNEGLIHISEIAPYRIDKAEDVLGVGETLEVVVSKVDEDGKIGLSIQQIDPGFASRKGVPAPSAE